jgi:hypothetical protein
VSEDVFRRARELEQGWSQGMSRLNWQGSGRDGEEVGGAAESGSEFADFLRTHREMLASDPYWQAYIDDLDRAGSRAGGDIIEGTVAAVETSLDLASARHANPSLPETCARRRAERVAAMGSSDPPVASPPAGRPIDGHRP